MQNRYGINVNHWPESWHSSREIQGEVLYHASLDPDEYKNLFETFGFRAVNMRFEDPDCARHTIWLAQLM